jgi:hypothetical protein
METLPSTNTQVNTVTNLINSSSSSTSVDLIRQKTIESLNAKYKHV